MAATAEQQQKESRSCCCVCDEADQLMEGLCALFYSFNLLDSFRSAAHGPSLPRYCSVCSTICRYFLQGACAFGDKCRFSHNKESSDEPSNVSFDHSCSCATATMHDHRSVSSSVWTWHCVPHEVQHKHSPTCTPALGPSQPCALLQLTSCWNVLCVIDAGLPVLSRWLRLWLGLRL